MNKTNKNMDNNLNTILNTHIKITATKYKKLESQIKILRALLFLLGIIVISIAAKVIMLGCFMIRLH